VSDRESNARILRQHMIAEAAHDLDGTLATVHPDALFEDQPVGLVLNGRSAVARHYQLWWNAFGLHTDGGSLHWVADDLVIGEADFVGAHTGRFLGIAPTGRTIRFPFMVVVRFRDGLLSGEKFFYDLNSIMAQIGEPSFATSE
jgi:hypothetical protein